MIPITEIHPMLVHFPIVLWISAETIAVITLSVFTLHAVLRLPAIRRRYPLTGICGLLVTADLALLLCPVTMVSSGC